MNDQPRRIEVERADLEKINDALRAAYAHHSSRDQASAALHLAHDVRYSPLTSELAGACARLTRVLSA